MAGYSAVAALLPELKLAWSLGNAEIGIVEGAFNVGYVVAVPILVTWTDRRDPRTIYLAATALGIVAALGLAFLARDLWSAALFRCLAGIALAGTFMPGLKILTDAVTGPKQSRWLAFYTASFSLGASASTAADRRDRSCHGCDRRFHLRRDRWRGRVAAGCCRRPLAAATRAIARRSLGRVVAGGAEPQGARLLPRLRRAHVGALRLPRLAGRLPAVRRDRQPGADRRYRPMRCGARCCCCSACRPASSATSSR